MGIAAYGMTKFTMEDKPIEVLLQESAGDLFVNHPRIDRNDVDAVLVSTNSNSKYLAPILAEAMGIRPGPVHSVENLCNSGANSIVSGYAYVASGLAGAVLVSGAERHDSPGRVLEWDSPRGEFKHPIFWGSILTKAYKRRFGVSDEDLAVVPAKNHRQARSNPNALSGQAYTVHDVAASKQITNDLRMLDCSRSCSGGASVLLASEDVMGQMCEAPVWISGIGQKTVSAGFGGNTSLDSIGSASNAARHALDMAGCHIQDIDVAEVHDAFSVCEPMALESVGLAAKGEGVGMIKDAYGTGSFAFNPRGGLIGAGHPLGATGVAQTVEIVQQLQSRAGPRQVDCARTGLVHNMSAAATSSTVLVLEA